VGSLPVWKKIQMKKTEEKKSPRRGSNETSNVLGGEKGGEGPNLSKNRKKDPPTEGQWRK